MSFLLVVLIRNTFRLWISRIVIVLCHPGKFTGIGQFIGGGACSASHISPLSNEAWVHLHEEIVLTKGVSFGLSNHVSVLRLESFISFLAFVGGVVSLTCLTVLGAFI